MVAWGATTPVARAADPLEVSLCRTFPPAEQKAAEAWQMERLKLSEAWRLATGKGVSIAVIDTGTSNQNTAYFNPNNVRSQNMVPIDDQDRKNGLDCDHGTGVVSLINSSRTVQDPRTNFAGVAPDAEVLALRALKVPRDEQGRTEADPLGPTIKAVEEAIKQRVRIINISQVAANDDPAYRKVIAKAIAANIIVVAAAGNSDQGLNGPAYPAAYPGVISVGASLPDDRPSEASYSAVGWEVTVAAPGEGVTVLRPSAAVKGNRDEAKLVTNQAYDTKTGTSFAAPLVTGVVALMLELNGDLTPAQVKQRLVETADRPVGTPPHPQLGWGVVNPLRALTGPAVATSGNPTPSSTRSAVTNTTPPARDSRPELITLGVVAGAGALAVLALTLKLVLPAASRRDFAPADPPTD